MILIITLKKIAEGDSAWQLGAGIIIITRPKPAYVQQGLDWIIGPGYSFVVFSTN